MVLKVALNTIQQKPNRFKNTPCGGSEVPGKWQGFHTLPDVYLDKALPIEHKTGS
jgi:hypothetical protein